jgi:protein-S-isoprenylcysteine O-methyltransferase Ste14
MKAAPPVLFAVAVGILGYALSRQLAAPDLLAAALTLSYLVWLVAEVPVTFRRSAQAPAESRTLLPYALARLGTASAAVLGPLPWTRWSPWLAVPVAAFAGGIALRLVATRTLGRFYSHHVVRRTDHAVVSGGPYRLVRHPAYAGMLLAHAGFVGFFANPASVAGLLLLIGAVLYRIRAEERVMWTVPGYPEFARTRARVLPGVW